MEGYTIKEAMEILDYSESSIRRKIKEGELQARLVPGPYGEQYIINADSVQRLKNRRIVVLKAPDSMPGDVSVAEDPITTITNKLREVMQEELQEMEQRLDAKLEKHIKERDAQLMQALRSIQERQQEQFKLLEQQKKPFLKRLFRKK